MYSGLKQEIVSGRLAGGERLREHEIGTRFHASRTPVREALKRLFAEGLVAQEPGVGLIVATYTTREIVDAYEVVEALDAFVARLAAERVSASDIVRLESILAAVGKAMDANDLDQAVALNARFEDALRDLPRNQRLKSAVEELHQLLSRMSPPVKDRAERLRERFVEHQNIVDAIRRRDPAAAEAAANDHVRRSRDQRLSTIADGRVSA